jgi:hypothetical protein
MACLMTRLSKLVQTKHGDMNAFCRSETLHTRDESRIRHTDADTSSMLVLC